uniref:Uncharacterized protein n=1 Tax=Anopheles culicifacies TaxID=139723 RepID=A0A182MB15_9DIPT
MSLLTEMHTIDGHDGKIRFTIASMENTRVSVEGLIYDGEIVTVEFSPMAHLLHDLNEATFKLPVKISFAGVLGPIQTGTLDGTHELAIGDDTVLDRILEREYTTLRLRLITDVRVFLTHTDHHTLVTRTSHDRRENGTRRIITSETRFAHSRAIVND